MPQICDNCDSDMDKSTLSNEIRINKKVGCNVCNINICFKCGLDYALSFGIQNNCLCPNCKSELGMCGEVDDLGEDKYGWGY